MTEQNLLIKQEAFKFIKDSLSERNIILVNSISGSGKTTFFKNFLKNKKHLYIPLSIKDSDPQIFFNKINNLNKNMNLPEFTIDFLYSIEKFTTNYLNEIFKNLPINSFIVFDDFQNIKSSEIINNIFSIFIKIIPKEYNLIILSREEFPFGYFDWQIERKILRLDTTFFRLSKEDIKNLFLKKYQKDLSDDELNKIYYSTDGIIAKILLTTDFSFTNIYTGLTQKLLQYITENELSILIEIAELPLVNEKNLRFSNNKEKIILLLETLYLENLFVEKNGNDYKIHDILREFLRIKAREIFKENYNEYMQKIGLNLYKLGYIDEAITIFNKLEDYANLFNILENEIVSLIYSNKLFSVEKYISYIENTEYSKHPLILFAKGYLNKFNNPSKAILYFNKALEIFKLENYVEGEKLVIGELFDIAQFYGEDFSIGGKLLDRAEKLLQKTKNFEEIDVRLLSYMGIISLLYEGDSKKSTYYFKLIEQTFEKDIYDLPIFFSYIQLYTSISYDSAGLFKEAEKSFKIANLIYKNAHKNPDNIFMFNFLSSIHELFTGKFLSSIKKAQNAIKLIEDWGLLVHKEHILTRIMEGYLYLGDTKNAKKILERIETENIYRTTFSTAMTYQLEAQLFLMENKLDFALKKAKESLSLFSSINGKVFEISTKGVLALILIEKGKYEEAENILLEIIKWSKNVGGVLQEFSAYFYLSYLYYKKGEKKNLLNILKKTMSFGKNYQIPVIYNQYPKLMSKILSLALKNNIENDYASYLIKLHELTPPEEIIDEDSWLWKIKIYTFGKFKVFVDDYEIKEWKGEKTLKLLKVLIALGGEEINVNRIIDILWDNVDFVKSKQNFEFTLRKLRNVLNDKEKKLIKLKNNKVSLNKDYVWIDVWNFDKLYFLLKYHKNKNNPRDIFDNYKEKIIDLYKGDFLESEEDLWIEDLRENYRKKFHFVISQS